MARRSHLPSQIQEIAMAMSWTGLGVTANAALASMN
ncbi:hypothetical protein ABH975_006267 [Bradyrhizobium ottawaense]